MKQHAAFSSADFAKLVRALSRDTSPAGVVLHIEAVTGLRVGDLLTVSKRAFDTAHDEALLELRRARGVTPIPVPFDARAWKRLRARWKPKRESETIAEWLCPSCIGDPAEAGYGAYRQLDRHLKVVGERLELTGRVHLQRLRRTVAVQALREGADVKTVQRKLGHRSAQATTHYAPRRRGVSPRQGRQ